MPENRFVYSVAEGAIAALENLLESVFGPAIRTRASGEITYADLILLAGLLLAVLVAHFVAAYGFRKKEADVHPRPETQQHRVVVLQTLAKPAALLIWVYGLYFSLMPVLLRLNRPDGRHPIRNTVDKLFDAGLFAALFWLFYRLTVVIDGWLQIAAARSKSRLNSLLAPLAGKAIRVIGPVVAVILALPLVGLPPESAFVVGKASSLLIVGALTWVLLQSVGVAEKALLERFDIKAADNMEARKVYTQVHVIGKSLRVVVSLFGLASMLMVFEEVRRLGASILASAGIVGIVVGFAAQRTIANLFAGFQLALTQPIRIDDVLVVEGEWGRVEEITLTYVVLHIWDDRRLILPLSYFIEKPFQNWTRVSADLLGSVFLFMDYGVSVAAIRGEVQRIVASSPNWDKRFWNVQVTDTTERSMQIRVLATAADSSKSWDLRCDIRERLIEFLQKNHPDALPRVRTEFHRLPFDSKPNGRNGAVGGLSTAPTPVSRT